MGKGSAFIIGGIIGAAVALLYAPRSGRDTRALVTEKINSAWGEAQELGRQAADGAEQTYQAVASDGAQVATSFKERGSEFIRSCTARGNEFVQTATERGSEFAQAAKEKGQQVYEKAATRMQDAAAGVSPVSIDKGDELREKIEAARQRIASQVAKNAQEDQEKFGDVIATPTEAVQNVAEATNEVPDEIAAAIEEATEDFEDE